MQLRRLGLMLWVVVSARFYGKSGNPADWVWWVSLISLAVALWCVEEFGRYLERNHK